MTPNNSDLVSIEVEDGVASLTLNRPPLNVIHIAMLKALENALAKLKDNPDVRVLLLRANGKMFSAGVDIADHTPEKVGEMIPLFDAVCCSLAGFPAPTIAVVHGHALGGGCELVLCCDLAVMALEAKIGQPEIQLAAMAPIAALRLPYLVGYRVAADLMFTGRTLTADEALNHDLVNAVLPVHRVDDWAKEKASQLAGLSRVALLLNKRALQMGYGNWFDSMEAIETLYLNELMNTEDAREGLAAFMERRKPVWKHS
jgi:cyclohexa-1,5-dienecarbonyl-CoA hydratase